MSLNENDLISVLCSDNTLNIYYKDNIPFGNDGRVILSGNIKNQNIGGSSIIDYNGRIVFTTSGRLYTGTDDSDFYTMRYLNDGTLDTSFGDNGIVKTNIVDAGGSDYSYGIAIDSQNRIIVVGNGIEYSGITNYYAIVRYLEDGSLDESFGLNGIKLLPPLSTDDSLTCVVIDSNDNIIVSGTYDTTSTIIMRLLETTGDYDLTFGGSETGYIILTPNSYFPKIKIDSQDRIILSGTNFIDGNGRFLLARLTSNGILDSTFGIEGIIIYDLVSTGGNSSAFNIAIDSNDNYYLVGARTIVSDYPYIVAVKFNSSGIRDTTFGENGIAKIEPGLFSIATTVTIDANNKLIIGGFSLVNNMITSKDFVVAKMSLTGKWDENFGNGGYITTDINGYVDDFPASVMVDSQNRIVVTGFTLYDGDYYNYCVIRYTENGYIDNNYRIYTKYSLDNGVTWKPISIVNKFKADYDKAILCLDLTTEDRKEVYTIKFKTNKDIESNTIYVSDTDYSNRTNNNIQNNIINQLMPSNIIAKRLFL